MNCGACLCAARAAAAAREGAEVGPGPGAEGVEGQISGGVAAWRAIVLVCACLCVCVFVSPGAGEVIL